MDDLIQPMRPANQMIELSLVCKRELKLTSVVDDEFYTKTIS